MKFKIACTKKETVTKILEVERKGKHIHTLSKDKASGRYILLCISASLSVRKERRVGVALPRLL